VTLTTHNGVQATGGQQVDAQVFNYDQNTLTNVVITFHPITTNLDIDWSAPKPSNCVPGTGDDAVCTIANVPGVGAAAKSPPVTPIPSQKVTLYFSSQATGVSPSLLSWNVSVRVQEGPSGQPNLSVREVLGSTTFSATGSDSPVSIALPGSNVLLGTTTTGNSSLKFSVPAGTPPYEASLAADNTPTFCLDGLSCYPLELNSSVPGSTGGVLIWHFIAHDPTFTKSQARGIHVRDGATTSADAVANTVSGDFRGIEGVRITGSAFDGDYWVRGATQSSFQLSVTETGPLFDIPGSGSVTGLSAAQIVIIGKPNSEVNVACKNGTGSIPTPSMFVEKVTNNDDDLEFWVCDGTNGFVGGGGG
jgi:hypothetical protein